ncbi:MAG: hypothetical protein IT445_18950 [Phycisphaeraceae bacterium]|nr:hypothetical protein [Phycisphaeraceae bacterium]
MSRERKILLGLLALGLSAVGVDRFVLASGETDPAAAEAQQYMVSPQSAESTAVEAPAATAEAAAIKQPVTPAGPSIAQRLRDTGQQQASKLDATRNVLTPEASWYGDQPATSAAQNPTQVDPIEQFLRTHTLSAVMNNRIAIVNGQPYRVGDSLVDFRLVAVGNSGATFQFGDQMVDLTLEQTAPARR